MIDAFLPLASADNEASLALGAVAGSVTVGAVAGSVTTSAVAGSVTADAVAGSVTAGAVAGSVTTSAVAGSVTVGSGATPSIAPSSVSAAAAAISSSSSSFFNSASTASPTGNATSAAVTCVGTAPATDFLGQIVFYLCWAKDVLFAFLHSLPLDFPLALGLFCGGVGLLLLLLFLCCCCCCRKFCCGKKTGKKRKQKQKDYKYLDPKLAPALKSKTNPKTAFDRLPLIGTYIQEKIQPGLYDIPETQMRMSRMEGDIGSLEEGEQKPNFGRIQFSLKRSGSKKTPDITVGVVQAVELEPKEQAKGDFPDSYVSVVLESKNKKDAAPKEVFETRIIRDESDPMFQETFLFKSVHKIEDKTLIFRVWHFDRIAVEHPPIAELAIEMSKFDLTRPVEEWHKLKEPDPEKWETFKRTRLGLGCLCLSLQYVPVISKLTMCVLEAKDLPKTHKQSKEGTDGPDVEATIDPMVKLSLKFEGKKVAKKKTAVKKNTENPYYNEIFHFTVAPEHIKSVNLSVTVVDNHGFGLTDAVGRIFFGPSAAGRARKHWEDVLEAQGRPIAQWHVLADPKLKAPKKK